MSLSMGGLNITFGSLKSDGFFSWGPIKLDTVDGRNPAPPGM